MGGHADVVFLIGAGRHGVHAAWMGDHTVLGDQGGRRHLGDHETGVQAAFLDQEGRQFAHLGIHQDRGAAFRDIANLAERHGDLIGSESNGFGVKVAARDDVAILDEDQRVVGHGVRLARQRGGGASQHIEDRAHDLGLAAQGVGVLDLGAVVAVTVADGGACHQLAQAGGDGDLARLTAQGVDAMIEGRVGSFQGIDRQGPGSDSSGERRLGREQTGKGQGRRTLGAVQQGQAFLRTQRQRRKADLRQSRFGLQRLAVEPRLAHADQDAGHMSQRRQVARGADRSLRRNAGQDVSVDQVDQGLQRLTPNSGGTTRQAGDLQHHQKTRHRIRQQRPDPAGVAENQITLQRLQVFRRDGGVGQQAEAGVDAIDGAPLGDDGGDGRCAPVHLGPGGGRQ